MTDNGNPPETKREEQPDLEQQQQGLFEELSREQQQAETALQPAQERSAEAE